MVLAFTLVFNMKDETDKPSSTKLRLPTTFAIADYVEFAQAAGQLILNLSQSRITNISLTIDFDFSALGLSSIILTAANIGKKAKFLWETAVTGFNARFEVPTVDESIFLAGTDDMNVSDPLVAPFILKIENGIVVPIATTVTFANNRVMDITLLASGYEIHAKT